MHHHINRYATHTVRLTVLNLAFLLGHVLKVPQDGSPRQVVEGLVPQVLVDLLLALAPVQVGLDVEHHLPPHRLAAQQARHDRHAVPLLRRDAGGQAGAEAVLGGLHLAQLVRVGVWKGHRAGCLISGLQRASRVL